MPTEAVPAKTVFASRVEGLCLDGITDDGTVLQVVLDLAQSGPLEFVLDQGTLLSSGNDLYSHTTVRTLPGAGWKLVGGATRPILRNRHKTKGAIVDRDIKILGGTFDGNNDHNRAPEQLGEHGYATVEEQGFLVPLGFFGVDGLEMTDVRVVESPSFSIHLANVMNVSVIRPRLVVATNPWLTMDGIHINGPARHIFVQDAEVSAWDNPVAFNADDTPNVYTDWIGGGDITDAVVDGLKMDRVLVGVRFLSSEHLLDRIVVKNITGSYLTHAVTFDWALLSPGRYGTLTIDGLDATAIADPICEKVAWGQTSTIFVDRMNIARLNLLNLQPNRATDGRPYLLVTPGTPADIYAPNLAQATGKA